MPHDFDYFQAWREANRAAFEKEKELLCASIQALTAGAPEPLPEHRDTAHKLRARANELFLLAMKEMDQRARAAKSR